MSNLPPGVTGNEDAFGPNAEITQVRGCDAEAEFVGMAHVTEEIAHLNAYSGAATSDEFRAALMVRRLVVQAETFECGFDGLVDVAYWNTTATWTCPRCGTEHEEELDEPDYD